MCHRYVIQNIKTAFFEDCFYILADFLPGAPLKEFGVGVGRGLVVGEVEGLSREREEARRGHVTGEARLALRESGVGCPHTHGGESLVASIEQHVESISRHMGRLFGSRKTTRGLRLILSAVKPGLCVPASERRSYPNLVSFAMRDLTRPLECVVHAARCLEHCETAIEAFAVE